MKDNIFTSKKFLLLAAVVLLIMTFCMTKCGVVPPGYVGVKVNLYGSSKGVNHEVIGVGRYWLGMNEQVYEFPTFQQNYTWTKNPHEGAAVDESMTFQTKEGLDVNADIGISYSLDANKVGVLFEKYRKGIEEITHVFLKNIIRNALNTDASTMAVADIYGEGKGKLFSGVKAAVQKEVLDQGIIIDNISLIGSFRLPPTVTAALNLKIEATQKALQLQNEVAQSRAEAEKEVAQAEGHAKATLAAAHAEAESNRLKQQSITDNLIRYEAIQKWDGQLPNYMGGNGPVPFLSVGK